MPLTDEQTDRRRPDARLGLLQVCLAGVLWGTGGLVVTVLHKRVGYAAMTVSAWRMLLAAVALVVFAVVTRRVGGVVRTFREHPLPAVAVGCGTAAYQGLYFLSVLNVGVSVSTVVSLGLAVVLAAAGESALHRRRPTAAQLAVLAAALAGLVLISVSAGHPSSVAGDPALGIALAVGSGATYAVTTMVGHVLAQRVEPVTLTTCATAVGAVALSPFLVVAAVGGQRLGTTDTRSLLLLGYLGLSTMALANGLLYAGLRTTSGAAATVATLLEPVTAAAAATVLLGERLPWPAWLGGALILSAVVALRPSEDPVPLAA
ncbi:MAG: EamA family transporter [Jatrophihabitans sp.]|uniref:EamA family transporter n=1 Tax=Jatrophihabitans sp. TaxID=1932789 RepID=UPI003F7F6F35